MAFRANFMGARCGGSAVQRVASIKPWPLVPLKPKEETSADLVGLGGKILRENMMKSNF